MRRFNYTGRSRLKRSDVIIELFSADDGGAEFEALFDLTKFKQRHADALIVVEAYLGSSFERFDFGTIDKPASDGRHCLETFRADDALLFRVMVVDTSLKPGRLVAIAKSIRPTGPNEIHITSLLAVHVDSLDNVVYKLKFPEDDLPLLILNEELDLTFDQGIKAIARGHPLFVSLVYPSVVRDILSRILLVERREAETDDEPSWVGKWIRFAKSKNPEPVPHVDEESDDPEPLVDWIETVVEEVGRELKVVRRFQNGILDKP